MNPIQLPKFAPYFVLFMKLKQQFTGAILGLCLGVGSMLVLGAGLPGSGQIGRFQATSSGAQFLIMDTTTGQAWLGDCHTTPQPVDPHFFDPKLQVTE